MISTNFPETEAQKKIAAISWNIATEPKLYRQLSRNPFTSGSLKIISKRFPGFAADDVIRAVVLAEPEGVYDRNFLRLPKSSQAKELYRQKNTSIEINKRLSEYRKVNAKELSRLPKELVYESLSVVVFSSSDEKEIEQKYSQNQRRDFRLSIVGIIQGIQRKLAPDRSVLKIIFAAASLLLLIYTAQMQIKKYSDASRNVLAVETQNKIRGYPVRLTIPSIGVNAAIEALGAAPENNTMQVPVNTMDVGWFAPGSRPGEVGSAVIDGHFNGEDGKPAVFAKLDKLKKDDKLYVDYGNGVSYTFVVQGSRAYDPGFSEEVFRSEGGIHLNLITCDGVWDASKTSYSKRLVVFADIAQ